MLAQAQFTEGVPSVNGKARLVQRVQDAQTVALLAQRVRKKPKLVRVIWDGLRSEDFAAWIWGEKSFAICEVYNSPIHGRIASLTWLESEPGFSTKRDVAPLVELWASERGAKKIATMVYKEAPWKRLTGWEPLALMIGKEL